MNHKTTDKKLILNEDVYSLNNIGNSEEDEDEGPLNYSLNDIVGAYLDNK
jgi:hypothetical protein